MWKLEARLSEKPDFLHSAVFTRSDEGYFVEDCCVVIVIRFVMRIAVGEPCGYSDVAAISVWSG